MIRHHRGITYEVGEPGACSHADVEYHVSPENVVDNHSTFITVSPSRALQDACSRAIQGKNVWLDICIWSEEGAKFHGGDDAVEQYRVDPDAAVFCRYEIKANCAGMVP